MHDLFRIMAGRGAASHNTQRLSEGLRRGAVSAAHIGSTGTRSTFGIRNKIEVRTMDFRSVLETS